MSTDRVVLHPAGEIWLRTLGLTHADMLADLPGEIVSGHTDRHVRRCLLGKGPMQQMVILKREHRIRWQDRLKHALAGWGLISKSEREARTLLQLQQLGFPAPRLLAHGQTATGVGFVLIRGIPDLADIRTALERATPSEQEQMLRSIGIWIARLVRAGIENPDLTAKHVCFHGIGTDPVFLDWQNVIRRSANDLAAGNRMLARLGVTLPGGIITNRLLLTLLMGYRRELRGVVPTLPRMSEQIRLVQSLQERFRRKRAIRHQLTERPHRAEQRLIWLDGEAMCVIPEAVSLLQSPEMQRECTTIAPNDARLLRLADGRLLLRVRERVRFSWGKLIADMRGRIWRMPVMREARWHFAQERAGQRMPRLLAFGQRLSHFGGQGFLLLEVEPALTPSPTSGTMPLRFAKLPSTAQEAQACR